MIKNLEVGTVRFHGDLDLSRKDEIRAELKPLYGCDRAVIDLSDVRYADSTTLGALVHLYKRMNENGHVGLIALVGVNPQLKKIFEITHLDSLFAIYDTASDVEWG